MRLIKALCVVVFGLNLAACAPNIGSNNYKMGQVQQVSQAQKGTIVSVDQVQVSGGSDGNWVGTLAGGAAGGIAGASIGQGYGSGLAAVGGALVGGMIGNAAEKKLTEQEASRYLIQLANGTTVAVVQKDNPPLPVGAKVLVIGGDPAQVIVDNTKTNGSD